MAKHVEVLKTEVLSDNWYVLRKVTFRLRKRDGSWEVQSREAYDRGNGATILLYDPVRRTVVLTRQFNRSLPAAWRFDVWAILRIVRRLFGQWVRAQLILGVTVGVFTFIGLLILSATVDPIFGRYAILRAIGRPQLRRADIAEGHPIGTAAGEMAKRGRRRRDAALDRQGAAARPAPQRRREGDLGVSAARVISRVPRPRVAKLIDQRMTTSRRF